jgi:hypothetical protein
MTSLDNADPSVVLVHGAYADGSSWSEVIRRLHNAGIAVTAVQNPLTSLADDVAHTRRVLARQPDLMPAIRARLIEVDGQQVRFRHPLMQSAIYQAATVAERYAAHKALAGLFADDPDRCVWHR